MVGQAGRRRLGVLQPPHSACFASAAGPAALRSTSSRSSSSSSSCERRQQPRLQVHADDAAALFGGAQALARHLQPRARVAPQVQHQAAGRDDLVLLCRGRVGGRPGGQGRRHGELRCSGGSGGSGATPPCSSRAASTRAPPRSAHLLNLLQLVRGARHVSRGLGLFEKRVLQHPPRPAWGSGRRGSGSRRAAAAGRVAGGGGRRRAAAEATGVQRRPRRPWRRAAVLPAAPPPRPACLQGPAGLQGAPRQANLVIRAPPRAAMAAMPPLERQQVGG